MTAIPHAAEALTSASGRFELASARLLKAASGDGGDMAAALVGMSEAKAQFKAGVGVLRFSDAMLRELIDIATEPK